MAPLNQWTPLIITLAIQAMVAAAVLTVPAMAPRVAQGLDLSVTYVGLFVSVAYAAAILASLAAGTATARYGSIRVSQTSLLLCAAGLALCAVPSPWALAAGAVLWFGLVSVVVGVLLFGPYLREVPVLIRQSSPGRLVEVSTLLLAGLALVITGIRR